MGENSLLSGWYLYREPEQGTSDRRHLCAYGVHRPRQRLVCYGFGRSEPRRSRNFCEAFAPIACVRIVAFYCGEPSSAVIYRFSCRAAVLWSEGGEPRGTSNKDGICPRSTLTAPPPRPKPVVSICCSSHDGQNCTPRLQHNSTAHTLTAVAHRLQIQRFAHQVACVFWASSGLRIKL